MIMEDDYIIECLRLFVEEIFMKEVRPQDGEMARLIDKNACMLTAYMNGKTDEAKKLLGGGFNPPPTGGNIREVEIF